MVDITAFMELSALLTGLYHQLSEDTEERELNKPTADEYARQLSGAFTTQFPALLDAYKALSAVNPKPPVDDALLAALRATQTFKNNEIVAKQIVNIWYFSQFKSSDAPSASLIDGGFYERGQVWPLIKAHPIGFSNQLHGYWSREPSSHAEVI